MKITGDAAHRRRLQAMASPETRRRIGQAILIAANEVKVEARLLITEGSISGAGHIPSKPGEPPNNDTGTLAGNIEEERTGPLSAVVESRAPYAVDLEQGNSKMEARPYMGPALRRKRGRIQELTHGVVEASIRGR